MAQRGFKVGKIYVDTNQFDKFAKMVFDSESVDSHKEESAIYARMIREQTMIAVAEKNNAVVTDEEIESFDSRARENTGDKEKLDSIIQNLDDDTADYHNFFIKPILAAKKLREYFDALNLNGVHKKTLTSLVEDAKMGDFAALAKANGAGYKNAIMSVEMKKSENQSFGSDSYMPGVPAAIQSNKMEPKTFIDKLKLLKEGEILAEVVETDVEMFLAKLSKISSETEIIVEMICFKRINYDEWLEGEISTFVVTYADAAVETEMGDKYGF
jgi:hypothetical protein